MSIWSKIFGGSDPESEQTDNLSHAVIVHFRYLLDDLNPLYDLEDVLRREVRACNVGMLDGHEISTDLSDGFLYLYGPDAEKLFKAIKEILEKTEFMRGASVKLRFGEPGSGAKQIEFDLA